MAPEGAAPPLIAMDCDRVPSQEPARVQPDPQWSQHYLRAAELFHTGSQDEAVKWFYIGQLRGRVHVSCVAQDASDALAAFFALNATLGQAINEHAGGNPADWAAAIDQALEWDEAQPDPDAGTPECAAERQTQRASLNLLRETILADADKIHRQRAENGLPNR